MERGRICTFCRFFIINGITHMLFRIIDCPLYALYPSHTHHSFRPKTILPLLEGIFMISRAFECQFLLHVNKRKAQHNGIVVGVGKVRFYIFDTYDLHVFGNKEAVHNVCRIAFFIRDIAVSASGYKLM